MGIAHMDVVLCSSRSTCQADGSSACCILAAGLQRAHPHTVGICGCRAFWGWRPMRSWQQPEVQRVATGQPLRTPSLRGGCRAGSIRVLPHGLGAAVQQKTLHSDMHGLSARVLLSALQHFSHCARQIASTRHCLSLLLLLHFIAVEIPVRTFFQSAILYCWLDEKYLPQSSA